MRNLPELDGVLDLWGAAFDDAERAALETSLIHTVADEAQPLAVRRVALTACHVLATDRLMRAVGDAWRDGHFSAEELLDVEREALPLRNLVFEAAQLRGRLDAVEALCRPSAALVPWGPCSVSPKKPRSGQ